MNTNKFKKIIGLVILIMCLNSQIIFAKENPNAVHFINSGKGDIVLIKTVDYNMLIDTGDGGHIKSNINYLKKQGVKDINDIIITNNNEENYGGLKEILKEFKVSRVLLPKCYIDKKERENIINILKENNINFESISKGFVYNKGLVSLEVLSPKEFDCTIENNNSLVLKGVIDDIKYLFMSDCQSPKELDIINHFDVKGMDVLKAAHHGLNDATCEKFIRSVDPKIAVITNSNETSYLEVKTRLEKAKTKVYSTYKNGNIKVKRVFTTKDLEVITDK